MAGMATLLSVNVVHQILDDPGGTPGRTAIDKRPLPGAAYVAERGIEGDAQLASRVHGRPWQAVYAYADEDLEWWRRELQRDLHPGNFGENLTTRGLDVTNAVIGERWRIGSGEETVVVEVTAPRLPCQTFTNFIGVQRWVRRFSDHGAPGAYLRVVVPGRIRAGDPIEVVSRPQHGVRIADIFPTIRPERAQDLLDAYDDGAMSVVEGLYDQAVIVAGRVAGRTATRTATRPATPRAAQ
jgi:MOSC domain-containing protein YiiM